MAFVKIKLVRVRRAEESLPASEERDRAGRQLH